MLIILFGAIIIFLSDKSRSNRVRSEGSASNWSMRCGGGRALPEPARATGGTEHLMDVGGGVGFFITPPPPLPPPAKTQQLITFNPPDCHRITCTKQESNLLNWHFCRWTIDFLFRIL